MHCPTGSRSPPGSRELANCECSYDKTWDDVAACCRIMQQITISSLYNVTGFGLNTPSICREPLRKSTLLLYTDISIDMQVPDQYEFILQYATMNSHLAVIHMLFENSESITLNLKEMSGGTPDNTPGLIQTNIKLTRSDARNVFTQELQHNSNKLISTAIELESKSLFNSRLLQQRISFPRQVGKLNVSLVTEGDREALGNRCNCVLSCLAD